MTCIAAKHFHHYQLDGGITKLVLAQFTSFTRFTQHKSYIFVCVFLGQRYYLNLSAALESMRNAHEAELQAERNKFLDMIAKTYSQADVEALQHQHESVVYFLHMSAGWDRLASKKSSSRMFIIKWKIVKRWLDNK